MFNESKWKQPPEVFYKKRSWKFCKIHRTEAAAQRCSEVFNFIEITIGHGCSPVNLLHIFRTPFPKNPPERLLLIGEHVCQNLLFNRVVGLPTKAFCCEYCLIFKNTFSQSNSGRLFLYLKELVKTIDVIKVNIKLEFEVKRLGSIIN